MTELQIEVPPVFPKTVNGTISTALPPSGEKQFRKISQKKVLVIHMPVLEAVKSQKWGGQEVPQSLPTFIDRVAPRGPAPTS